MSNFLGNVQQGLRVSGRNVQKWIFMPTDQIAEWSVDGFSLGESPESTRNEIFVASEFRMLFNEQAKIEVLVLDENGHPISGIKVDHGWPSTKWPEFDESVMRVTDDDGKVEWAIFAEFDPMTDIGPLWVTLNGFLVSDVVMGMGIPLTFHYKALITYRIIFRKQLLKHEVHA